jgi:O-antigen/teichoic acid export membrane protein
MESPGKPAKARRRWLAPQLTARVGFGLLDQGASSITNFGLVLVAGRLLSPGGLGVVTVGFAGYVLMLVLQRALISDPLVVVSSHLSDGERTTMAAAGLSTTIVAGALGSALMALLGLMIPGSIGSGLLIFAPWILPSLVQDFWRFVLFRDGRGVAAVANDGAWLTGMILAAPLLLHFRTTFAVVSWWGVGTASGAVLGFLQTRIRPRQLGDSMIWWRAQIWPFSRFLTVDYLLNYLGPQASLFLIAGLLGASALGGLKAVQSVFAPMTFLGPTVSIPGLPLVAATLQGDEQRGRHIAFQLSAIALVGALIYLLVLGRFGRQLLRAIFGPSFVQFRSLIVPIGVGQALAAFQIGLLVLLKAAKKGGQLIIIHAISSPAMLLGVWVLAAPLGVQGGAWGLATGEAVETGAIAAFAWPIGRRKRIQPRPT